MTRKEQDDLVGRKLIEYCMGKSITQYSRMQNENHVIVIRSEKDIERFKDFASLMEIFAQFGNIMTKHGLSFGEILDILTHIDAQLLKEQARREILKTVQEIHSGERKLEN